MCVCQLLRPVANRTKVSIVQHPRERFHPLNTARIAEGCLERVQVLRGELKDLAAKLRAGAIAPHAWLLFPSPNAAPLEARSDVDGPAEIVVLDGTWHHAAALLRDLPALRELRPVRLTPQAPSEYRIRREPRAEYLSTVESIAHVLTLLEPETAGIEQLRKAFRAMIDRNVAARRVEPIKRFNAKRRRSYAFPDALSAPQDSLVAYAEGARVGERSGRHHPLVIVLERPATGELRELVVRVPGQPAPRLLAELGLEAVDVEQGLTPEMARDSIADFMKHSVVVAWNRSTLSILEELGAGPSRSLLLKAVYCDYRRSTPNHPGGRGGGWGKMSTILAREGLEMPPPHRPGRPARRLRQTAILLELLQRAKAVSDAAESSGLSGPPLGRIE